MPRRPDATMGETALFVLCVEGRRSDQDETRTRLVRAHAGRVPRLELHMVPSLGEARRALTGRSYDVVLLELELPDSSGSDTFKAVANVAGRTPIVIYSGVAERAIALQCLKDGAEDFVQKDMVDDEGLLRALLFAIVRRAQSRPRHLVEPFFDAVAARAIDMI